MPLMRPPHYQGVKYNGSEVPLGSSIEILERDVADLAREGWEIVADVSFPIPPATVVSIDDEER